MGGLVDSWRDRGSLIEIDGRKIFVVDTGSGPDTVLILHGFPGSSFDWRRVVPLLAEHARVVVYDMLGYGLSEKPLDAKHSLFEHVDLAEALAKTLDVSACTLVSHDMGDTVAAELIHRSNAGELSFAIERSILTNGSIFMHLVQLSAGQMALLSMPDEILPESLPLDAFRPGLAVTFSNEHAPSNEELDAMLELIDLNDGSRLLPRQIRYVEERRANQPRWTSALVDYPGPMTALWGEQDPIAVVAMPHHLNEIRPATEVVTWPDVGHWPSIEVPDRLAAAIAERL